ncbi:MAG: hypothetical protein O2948_00180 [Proteobacteria bacterium]|nr:hypothetical protein [Pseudomonadota bacterium]MDA0928649.1 hypothetical protein [Pseudomonadota bacterium]
MPITTFDTHKFVRRLEQAGMKLELAEAQAEVLTEAFNVNLESLVTKDFLAARFAEQNAYFDTRFAELESRLVTKIDSNQRVAAITQAIIIAAVVLPYLERLMAL